MPTLALDWASWVALEGWNEEVSEESREILESPVRALARRLPGAAPQSGEEARPPPSPGSATRGATRSASPSRSSATGVEFLGGALPGKAAKATSRPPGPFRTCWASSTTGSRSRRLLQGLAEGAPAQRKGARTQGERLDLERGIRLRPRWQAQTMSAQRAVAEGAWSAFVAQKPFWHGKGIMSLSVLVTNTKGGCGKTTIATNLASAFANAGFVTQRSADVTRQKSSLDWLANRPDSAAPIIGLDWRKRPSPPPGPVRRLVIDAPGGFGSILSRKLLKAADLVVVPVLASVFDQAARRAFSASSSVSSRSPRAGRPSWSWPTGSGHAEGGTAPARCAGLDGPGAGGPARRPRPLCRARRQRGSASSTPARAAAPGRRAVPPAAPTGCRCFARWR